VADIPEEMDRLRAGIAALAAKRLPASKLSSPTA
jgi:hypothetical protein